MRTKRVCVFHGQTLTFVVEQTEISQDEPLPLPQTHPGAVLQEAEEAEGGERMKNEAGRGSDGRGNRT